LVRPIKNRLVAYNPDVSYFKPRGIPMVDLAEVCLTVDEREALRLADLDGLSHEDSGQCMGVSRATFGRILHKARQTVADALINGKAIKVDGGNYRMVAEKRRFLCRKCRNQWDEPLGTGRPERCPACGNDDFHRFVS
jgi:predicted DNA-binding protein (UPF0251 family)